jgi:hypothetical protein
MYTTFDEVAAYLPAPFLSEATDDDGNGVPEMFQDVADVASAFVNGKLSTAYAVPLVGPLITSFIRSVTTLYAAKVCFGRRGMSEAFPYHEELANLLKQLDLVATGKLPLVPSGATGAGTPAGAGGAVILGEAKTHSASGRLSI